MFTNSFHNAQCLKAWSISLFHLSSSRTTSGVGAIVFEHFRDGVASLWVLGRFFKPSNDDVGTFSRSWETLVRLVSVGTAQIIRTRVFFRICDLKTNAITSVDMLSSGMDWRTFTVEDPARQMTFSSAFWVFRDGHYRANRGEILFLTRAILTRQPRLRLHG